MILAFSSWYISFNYFFGCEWQTETHEGKLKSPNHAWLSLDLLEALCRLAEVDRSDQVHEILEFPRNHCPELLALGLVQVNIGVSLKVLHS